jgi:hypothetical protein
VINDQVNDTISSISDIDENQQSYVIIEEAKHGEGAGD